MLETAPMFKTLKLALILAATLLVAGTPSAEPRAPQLAKVVQVAVVVRDLPRAIAFYRDTLGLGLMFETNGMAFFDAAGMRLMVGRSDTLKPGGGSVIYFDAGDWRTTEQALLARGVRFTAPAEIVQREPGREHALREFTDPDGNLLAIMGWRPAS
jgi:catechol 2,3-dioxygenase-like lactoylglutathione lyase family enzyme